MTQYDQSNYLPYSESQSRPTVVTVLAVIGIIFGGFGVLSALLGLVTSSMALLANGANPLAPNMPHMGHSVLLYSVAIAPVHLLLSIAAVIGCIGALYLKPWAHKTMMLWSIATIVLSVVGTIVQVVWVGPMTMSIVTQMQPNNPIMTTQFVQVMTYVGAVFGLLLSCALPVLILTLWNAKKVKHAFHSVSPA